MVVLDEHGNILRDSNLGTSSAMDFKLQPHGMGTYFDNRTLKYYGLDSNWNVVDSFGVARDYHPDGHDLRVFPDTSYAIIGATQDARDMRQYITGGNSDASVTGGLVQEMDRDGNIIFQWRGIDHLNILDAVHVDFTSPFIDFEHLNSIEFEHPDAQSIESAGDLIISNRHLCEITRIDGQTGAIRWRFGGAHNQFTLIGDSVWFSYQHAVRLLPNGHITLFDNANFDSVAGEPDVFIHQSRALEYELDTMAMTAKLAWQFHHTPETFADAMGYVQRLGNGNTLIGWGDNTLAITEVDRSNETVFEMQTPPGNFSYRAFKYPTAASGVTASLALASGALEIAMDGSGSYIATYSVSKSEETSLVLFDNVGREVRTIFSNSFLQAGEYSTSIDLGDMPDGVYWCELRTVEGNICRAVVKLK